MGPHSPGLRVVRFVRCEVIHGRHPVAMDEEQLKEGHPESFRRPHWRESPQSEVEGVSSDAYQRHDHQRAFVGSGKSVKDILVANGNRAWNEKEPGIGATPAPAGAAEQRMPLIWLTPYGAIWAAIDAADPAQVQVTQAGGKTVINTSFEGMQVKATLGTDHRPETVEVQTKQGIYPGAVLGLLRP